MGIPFRLVDVFTDRPLQGNQLCVVPGPVDIEDGLMQALAREIGFSETTFVGETGEDWYELRIFTPGGEMPFAGHPTLGTAFVLAAEGRVSSPMTQRVAAGEFRVEVELDGDFARMHQHPPWFGPEILDRARVARALGLREEHLHPDLPAQVVSTGLAHLLVPARDSRVVRSAMLIPHLVHEVVTDAGVDAMYLFAETEQGAKARLFAPGLVRAEDPATGSAAGPLGAYLAERELAGLPGRMVIHQGEEAQRPSTIHVEVSREGRSWSVIVGGGVSVVGRGEFEI